MIPLINFKKLHKEAKLPQFMLDEAIGADLSAFCLTEQGRPSRVIVPPRNTRAISTGLTIEPPPFEENAAWVACVLSRSGMALRSIFVANAPGLIDPDYRGEIKVLLYNGGLETIYIEHEQRIAQLVLTRMTRWSGCEVEALSPSQRGEKGFGSTGR